MVDGFGIAFKAEKKAQNTPSSLQLRRQDKVKAAQ